MKRRIDFFTDKNRFLSNFWKCRVVVYGVTYPSVEHAYQAAKCQFEADRDYIIRAPSPGRAKMIGQQVAMVEDWDKIKLEVMLRLLRAKFEGGSLAKRLLATGDLELIEGNRWHDNYWGVCKCGKCCGGQNQLGELLMQVRDEIKLDETSHGDQDTRRHLSEV